MPKRTSDFREELLADLRDPQEAANYLNAAMEDSEQMALVALRDIAEARQMARIAEAAGVAREALYRMLSKTGNPTYGSFTGVLNALGLRMVFVPIAAAENDEGRQRYPQPLPPQTTGCACAATA
jgi:probable addiction module antidote protein